MQVSERRSVRGVRLGARHDRLPLRHRLRRHLLRRAQGGGGRGALLLRGRRLRPDLPDHRGHHLRRGALRLLSEEAWRVSVRSIN